MKDVEQVTVDHAPFYSNWSSFFAVDGRPESPFIILSDILRQPSLYCDYVKEYAKTPPYLAFVPNENLQIPSSETNGFTLSSTISKRNALESYQTVPG